MVTAAEGYRTKIVALSLTAAAVSGHGLPMIPLSGAPQMPSADASQEAQTRAMELTMTSSLVIIAPPCKTMTACSYQTAPAVSGLGLLMTQTFGRAILPSADVKTMARPTEDQQMVTLMTHQVAPITAGARLA